MIQPIDQPVAAAPLRRIAMAARRDNGAGEPRPMIAAMSHPTAWPEAVDGPDACVGRMRWPYAISV